MAAAKVKFLQQGTQAAHQGWRILCIGRSILAFPGWDHIVSVLELYRGQCCGVRVKHDLACAAIRRNAGESHQDTA